MLNRLVPAAALAAAALVPAGVLAQEERTSAVPIYNLVQLAVDPDKVSAEEFSAKLETVTSCEAAVKASKAFRAVVTRNDYVRASNLPDDMAAMLKELPTGQPSSPFRGKDGKLRVLVICNRS